MQNIAVRHVRDIIKRFIPFFLTVDSRGMLAAHSLAAWLPSDFGKAGNSPTNGVTPGFCESEWSETPASRDAKNNPCFP